MTTHALTPGSNPLHEAEKLIRAFEASHNFRTDAGESYDAHPDDGRTHGFLLEAEQSVKFADDSVPAILRLLDQAVREDPNLQPSQTTIEFAKRFGDAEQGNAFLAAINDHANNPAGISKPSGPRTPEEIGRILLGLQSEANSGSGLHYEIFATNYVHAIHGFRASLADPAEVTALERILDHDGVYQDGLNQIEGNDLNSKTYLPFMERKFAAAPKSVPVGVTRADIFDVPANETRKLSGVTTIGNLRLGDNAVLDAPDLTVIEDNLLLSRNATLRAPVLARVGYFGSHSTTELGNGRYLRDFTQRSQDGLDIPTVKIDGGMVEAPLLSRIDADLVVRDTQIALPALIKLKGALVVENATGPVSLPLLQQIGAEVSYPISEESTGHLATVTRLRNCIIDAPRLTNVIGSTDRGENVQWNHPLNLEMAWITDRLCDVPADLYLAEVPQHPHRLEIIAASKGVPSEVLERTLMKLRADERILGLTAVLEHLTQEDTDRVLRSFRPKDFAEEIYQQEIDHEGNPDYDRIDPAQLIATTLRSTGRQHLAPPALIQQLVHNIDASWNFHRCTKGEAVPAKVQERFLGHCSVLAAGTRLTEEKVETALLQFFSENHPRPRGERHFGTEMSIGPRLGLVSVVPSLREVLLTIHSIYVQSATLSPDVHLAKIEKSMPHIYRCLTAEERDGFEPMVRYGQNDFQITDAGRSAIRDFFNQNPKDRIAQELASWFLPPTKVAMDARSRPAMAIAPNRADHEIARDHH